MVYMAAIVITFAVVFLKQKSVVREQDHAAARAAKKGGQWLLSYQGNFSDPGIFWAMSEMNNNYCHLDSINRLVDSRFASADFSPQEQAYKRLFNYGKVSIIDYTSLAGRAGSYDDILIPALYCDINPLPQNVEEKIFDIKNSLGYDLTHRYLAMLFLRRNNCNLEEVNEVLPQAAEKIAQQQQSINEFSDLSAERAVFLQLGGFFSQVGKDWVAEITESQSPDGGWKYTQLSNLENPHTAALATWALANYSKTCVFN